eukprot:s671_g16.t1
MIVCRLAHGQCSETSCTSQAIHQLRRLADENDVQNLVVTILLPPWRFHEVYKHLWAAVARIPSSDAMQVYAEGWEDVEQCMAHAVAFYSQPALQKHGGILTTRVDALWKLLTSHKFALLLDGLQRLPSAVLQDVSLQREAVAAAKEMMGMDRGQRLPYLCLQTTVGNKCAERVVSALAAALHVISDQGRAFLEWLWRLWDLMVLPCYPPLFQALQECLLDSRADDTEEDYLVAACTSAWHKHTFFELSHCVVKSGLMGSYCKYLAQRFGFPSVAADLLEVWAEPYDADEQLPGRLPSSQSETFLLAQSSKVGDLRILAQKSFQRGFLRLATADHKVVDPTLSLQASGLEDGDHLTAIAVEAKLAATDAAFALFCSGGDRVVAWGDPSSGGDSSHVQDQLKGVQQVQATNQAFAAILADGSVVTWGDPHCGGNSSEVQDQLKDVQQVQAANQAFAAILADGSVVTWGDPDHGGDSSEVQDQLNSVQQVQATLGAFAAILADGSVVTWGDLDGGDSSEVQDQLKGVQQVQAAWRAFAAILASGSVVTWGDPDRGGDSSEVQDQLKGVQQVQASRYAFAAILADGSVVTWGDPDHGGDSSKVQDQLKGVQQVQASRYAFAAILADGSVVTWGHPDYGGDSSEVQDRLKGVQQVQATLAGVDLAGAFAAILADGSVVTWGNPGYGGDSSAVAAQCHRSDFLALSYLFREGVPPQVLEQLRDWKSDRATSKASEALFGPGLASTVLELLEGQLQTVMRGPAPKRKAGLNLWHHSFSAARATMGERLPMSRACRGKLRQLSFFSDLVPCMMDHEGSLSILAELLAESRSLRSWNWEARTMDRRQMQNRCLRRLATQLEASSPDELVTARFTLQQILDDLLGPLRRADPNQVVEVFCECVSLVLDIVDSRGIFASCYAIVTPALGASALQGLLETLAQHKGGQRQTMLQTLSQEFCQKVGDHPCLHQPLSSWMQWTEDQIDPDTSSLPYLLYFAWRAAGTELLELGEPLKRPDSRSGRLLESLRRNAAAVPSNLFSAVRRAVQHQHLLDALAQDVVRSAALRGAELQQFVGEGEGGENALVQHAGSTASAGKALESLRAGPEALQGWAKALAKPERSGGHDRAHREPDGDLPVSSMPGFEHERERRRREDQEREQQDQQYASRADCCDAMVCGSHAHEGPGRHGEGCGHQFNWNSAPRYQPSLAEQRQPPGFSAILAWAMLSEQDFQSPHAAAAAEAALQGLSPEDRRYACVNACACAFIKRNQTQPGLAMALTSPNCQRLRGSLGFQDQRLARVVAAFCDPQQLPTSDSLVAAVFLGRDDWEQVAGNNETQAQRLKNAIVNLLVAILGAPDNNHLMMLLLEPYAMLQSFPVGFVYGAMPGPEGYHFDCGCVLDVHGRVHRNRAPLDNSHLHFVNFCSWSVMAIGLWIFPENCNNIGQVLTERHIREVDGGRRAACLADSARSFAMNYALQNFECVCRHQGHTQDDRSLAFARLFQRFRQRAVNAPPEFARTFTSPEARQRYEEIWRVMIDEIVQELPELRTEMHLDL